MVNMQQVPDQLSMSLPKPDENTAVSDANISNSSKLEEKNVKLSRPNDSASNSEDFSPKRGAADLLRWLQDGSASGAYSSWRNNCRRVWDPEVQHRVHGRHFRTSY